MGRAIEHRTISVSLSRHNSEQDASDDADFEQMLDRIEDLLREYPQIQAEMY